MSDVKWLHISDLHIGQPSPKVTWDVVRETMIKGISQYVKTEGKVDILIITGDIAYSGAKDEYAKASSLVAEIADKSGAASIIAVPGNHDVQRPSETKDARFLALRAAARDEDARDAAISMQSLLPDYLSDRFVNYKLWWQQHSIGLSNLRNGLFPGDYSATISVRGLDIGIIGLNTCAGNLADAEEGEIWFHPRQLYEVCGGQDASPTDWAEKHHLTLLLTHHPPSWFASQTHADYTSEVYTGRRFSAHLFGHVHEAAAELQQSAGSTRRTTIQSRSFFGLESYRTKDGRQYRRSHGFSIAKCTILPSSANLGLLFREAKWTSGEWSLHTDSRIGGDFSGSIVLETDRPSRELSLGAVDDGQPLKKSRPVARDTPDFRAIQNVIAHGDTDILPFPVENRIIRAHPEEFQDLVESTRQNFVVEIAKNHPVFLRCLVRTGHTRYRWATQVDPLWNAVFLAEIIEIAPIVEAARSKPEAQAVFSYRFSLSPTSPGDLFRRDFSWSEFQKKCQYLAQTYTWVVRCDISNFYGSISHTRLSDTLEQQDVDKDSIGKVRAFLGRFAHDGHGLPVGGAAARILSEAVLTSVDQILEISQIPYCRYSDDFALFAVGRKEAEASYFLFVKALRSAQGLVAQDLKTRIVRSVELVRALESQLSDDPAIQQFLKLKVRWDPYTDPNKTEYERVKEAIENFDIFGMITAEMKKTRLNETLTRRLLGAVRVLSLEKIGPILRNLVSNLSILTPVLTSVLQVIEATLANVDDADRINILNSLVEAVQSSDSPLYQDEAVLAHLIRIIGRHPTRDISALLDRVFSSQSELVGRDVIHAMAINGK
ncbi:MAG TPA: metallophosphoesterase, partial [Thermoanaerobaculia bacterium]|nr:metallophosphoesterase [Thermoanaerobaculia bacterium]